MGAVAGADQVVLAAGFNAVEVQRCCACMDTGVHAKDMDGYEQQRLLWFALRRLVSANRALEEIHSNNSADIRELRQMRDEARREVESYLPPDAMAELAARRAELRAAESGLDRDSSDFADTALLIGISTAASILIAPFGAWIVAESIIKELVKATVSGLFVGMATAAAELFVRRRVELRSSPELIDSFAVATESITRGYIVVDDPEAGSVRGSTPKTDTALAQNHGRVPIALPLTNTTPTHAGPPATSKRAAESYRYMNESSGSRSPARRGGEPDSSEPDFERGGHSL